MPEPVKSIVMVKTTKQPAKSLAAHRPVERLIHVIRGQKVMLDDDLADLYGVETGQLNRAVKRNPSRFPEDLMFQLTAEEAERLRCQIGISNRGRGGRRYLPHAFTEHGVVMLSSVLNSDYAITYTGNNLTLAAKALTVTANNKNMIYGGIDPALTYTYMGLISDDGSANFTGALARTSGNNAGIYSILQNTLTATGNYTIGTYNPGVFTITAAATMPVNTIPNTVVRMSQAPLVNTSNNSNSGSFATNASIVVWKDQPNTNTNAPAPPPENTQNSTTHTGDAVTSSPPPTSGAPSDSDSKKDDTDHAYNSSLQPEETQQGWQQSDPVLAKQFNLNARRNIHF